MKISVVINTYNAEPLLERVLESVKNFDQILICDMHSTDRTLEIAEKYNCTVVFHEHTKIVEPARAFAIASAKHDWIVVIDADEVVQPGLYDYIVETVTKKPELRGLYIASKNYMFGRLMRASYPNYLMRIFRKDSVEWAPQIHSRPKIDGLVDRIPENRRDLALIHLSNDSMTVMMEKKNRYSNFEIKRRADEKYGVASLMFEPMWRFLKYYIIKGAFRDGVEGLVFSKVMAHYKFLTIAKVIEAKLDPDKFDKELKGEIDKN